MRPQSPQADVENRTDARSWLSPSRPASPRAGHGWYAHEARRALGVSAEVLGVRVPLPFFHGAVGLIAASTAPLVAPQRVGAISAAALDLLLTVCAVGAILYYDRILCPAGARPGVEAAVLPSAALLALFIVVAGGVAPALVVVAIGVCALVVGGVPHIDALRAAGRQGAGLRGLRELAGLLIVVPVGVLAADPPVPVQVRVTVAFAGWAAASFDLLRSGAAGSRQALPPSIGVRSPGGWIASSVVSVGSGAAVAGLASLIRTGGAQTSGAAALLLAGYGVRGIAVQLARGRRGGVLLEYAAFAVAGLGILVTAR